MWCPCRSCHRLYNSRHPPGRRAVPSACAPRTSRGATPVPGQVDLVEALGAETLIYVSTPSGAQFVARQNDRTGLRAGDAVSLDIDASHAHWFDPAGRVVAGAAA